MAVPLRLRNPTAEFEGPCQPGGMRIVVTGATGNVGTAVLRRLHRASDVESIVGIARRLPDRSDPLFAGVDWHSIDISSAGAVDHLTAVLAGADAVIHLAWALQPNHDERTMAATNVGGLLAVLAASAAVGVPQVVVASSVGAYSPGDKVVAVDESWPTGGIHTSHYARHKAAGERILDRFESDHPEMIITRLRPGIILQDDAPAEIGTLFFGPLVPSRILGRLRLPVLPLPIQLVFQAVHADDVADAYWRAVDRRARGAFNVVAEPVLDPPLIARIVADARWIPMRLAVLRALAAASWHLRLQRTDPGWVDLATRTPLLSAARARDELGWTPTTTSVDALRGFLEGLAAHRGRRAAPPLAPDETLTERVDGTEH